MPKQPERKQPKVFAVAVIAIVVIGIVAVLLSRGGDDDAEDAAGETAAVEVTGDALPPLTDGPDGAVGQAAPALAGQTLDGEPVTLPADRPTIVIFLAHWCSHCQAEVPVITDWIEANGMPEGVELVAVSTALDEARGNFPPSSWLQRERWPITTMADSEDGDAATAYGLRSFPYFVAVDGNGDVVARASGELTTDQLGQLVAIARGEAG